eukprot:s2547_g5.t1
MPSAIVPSWWLPDAETRSRCGSLCRACRATGVGQFARFILGDTFAGSFFTALSPATQKRVSFRSLARYCGSGMDALVIGWGRSGRYYGSGMDALEIGWGRSRRYYGCGLGMFALVIGWDRSGRYYDWGMDALRERIMDALQEEMDAVREQMRSECTLLRLP